MIVVILIIWLVALVALGIFFRARIAGLARGIAFSTAATWNDFLTDAWPVIGPTVIVAAVLGFAGWFVLVAILISVGVYANAVVASIVIALLFPFWFVAFISPAFLGKVWVLGPIVKGVRFICTPILLVATVSLLVGMWSPSVKASFDRSAKNAKQSLANWLDKKSILSEPEHGIRGIVKDTTVVYDENAVAYSGYEALPGLEVELINLKNEEYGMYFVRLANKRHDFTKKCSEVYIPRDKITLK